MHIDGVLHTVPTHEHTVECLIPVNSAYLQSLSFLPGENFQNPSYWFLTCLVYYYLDGEYS